jgi:hypothetical protein
MYRACPLQLSSEYSPREAQRVSTRRSPRRRSLRARGSVVIIVALSLVALLGLTGLVVDGGNMMATRRRAQNAADSAALAGAVALLKEGSSAVARADALLYAEDNGFKNSASGSMVSVYSPPISGSHAGDAQCVQVKVYKELPSYFIRLLIQRQPSVLAEAVATYRDTSSLGDGVICLHPTDAESLRVHDTAKIDVVNGGVMVNSKSTNGAIKMEGASRLTANRVRVTGNAQIGSNAAILPNAPVTGVPPISDPLANMPAPDPQALGLTTKAGINTMNGVQVPPTIVSDTITNVASGGSSTSLLGGLLNILGGLLGGGNSGPPTPVSLTPGVYKGGIQVNNTQINLAPGIYIMDGGGFQVYGASTVTGRGVMIYNTSYTKPAAPIVVAGQGQVNLSALEDGAYKDMLFFQDPANTYASGVWAQGNITAANGTFYFPKSTYAIFADGSTLDLSTTQFIVNKMFLSGNASLRVNFDPKASPGTTGVTLVD